MRPTLINAVLALSVTATCVLASPVAAAVVPSYEPHDPLKPGQLILCSHGAHSDVVVDTLTTPEDTPNTGSTLFEIPRDSCKTVVDVPDGNYPIDGTYHVYLQGFKERPLACESPNHDPDCQLPFHHIELTRAAKPGTVNVDSPEVTVTISSLDGVRVDFVHRGDYRGAGRQVGDFRGENPQGF